jgi:NDP-sugar pyrophosphorylase family protein
MRRVNIIPLAGDGKRFFDAGFKTPKPLIKVDGVSMILKSAKSLPYADLWIFICRENHLKKTDLKLELNKYFPQSIILGVDNLTDGQLSTCLIARDYLKPDDKVTIGACDNGMIYNQRKYEILSKKYDVLIWTFRNNVSVEKNPDMYGWVKTNKDSEAISVSCKKHISKTPMRDHAVAGTFSFNKANEFLKCSDLLISKNIRVNNEFYLDLVMNECIRIGLNVLAFEVDEYFCWGTPSDLKDYRSN